LLLQARTQLLPLQVTEPLAGAVQTAHAFPHELGSVLPFATQVSPQA
jgi:hypothetical protein